MFLAKTEQDVLVTGCQDRYFSLANQQINTPRSASCCRDKQENKAVESGEFATVQYVEEVAWAESV